MTIDERTPLAERLARSLASAGATAMFGVPGGGPNLDLVGAANAAGIRFVLAHAENHAAVMASTHALLTRTPTAAIATRGPGATSITNGAAQATLDRYPLIIVTDTVPHAQRHRVAHQRLDQHALFAPISKHSTTVSDTTPTSELDALCTQAQQWPFGAVHLDYDTTATTDPSSPSSRPSSPRPSPSQPRTPVTEQAATNDAEFERARSLIALARRPVVLVGMEAAVLGSAVGRALERFGCPVLTTYQAIGAVASEGRVNAGLFTGGAIEQPVLDAADLVVTVGLDLVEPIPAPWRLDVAVVRLSGVPQVDDYLPVDADVIGDVVASANALLVGTFDWQPDASNRFRADVRSSIRRCDSSDVIGPIAVVDSVIRANDDLDRPPTVTVDAGAHFLAAMPLLPAREPFDVLISNGLATMGFAIPAAIGAAIARPGRPVIALTGDGGMAMTMSELETIARLDLPITVVVFNDAALSLIRIKQRDDHGGPQAVRYRQTDFGQIAAASGLRGTVVTTQRELASALKSIDGRPRLIDARIDPDAYAELIRVTRG